MKETMQGLTAEIHALRNDYIDIANSSRRERRLLRGVLISFCFDVLLTGGLWLNFHRTNDVVRHNKGVIRVACDQANQVRVADRQLWEYLLSLPPQAGQQPPDPARVAGFRAALKRSFQTVDCENI